MMMMKQVSMLAAAVVLSLGTAASAATISWGDGSSPGDNLDPSSMTGAVLVDATTSILNVSLSPFDGSAIPNAEFNSVGADATATYVFSSLRTSLSMIWGSVDTYNFIDFYNGVTLLGTFNGAAAGPIFTSNRALTAILATIGGFGQFDSVVLRSPGANAFEHASVAAVPVPAAGFLLIGALGGLAALRRRRKTA